MALRGSVTVDRFGEGALVLSEIAECDEFLLTHDERHEDHEQPEFFHRVLTTSTPRSPTAWFARTYIASAYTGGCM